MAVIPTRFMSRTAKVSAPLIAPNICGHEDRQPDGGLSHRSSCSVRVWAAPGWAVLGASRGRPVGGPTDTSMVLVMVAAVPAVGGHRWMGAGASGGWDPCRRASSNCAVGTVFQRPTVGGLAHDVEGTLQTELRVGRDGELRSVVMPRWGNPVATHGASTRAAASSPTRPTSADQTSNPDAGRVVLRYRSLGRGEFFRAQITKARFL